MMFHPSLSHASPVQNAFPHIDWNDDPVAVSRPEVAMLQSAADRPLEYTLADYGDAFAYVRVLLKVLDQATGPSDGNGAVSMLPLDAPVLDEIDAVDVYERDKSGTVSHYVISRLYELIATLLEEGGGRGNSHRNRTRTTMFAAAAAPALSDPSSCNATGERRLQQHPQRQQVATATQPPPPPPVVSITTLFYQNQRLLEDWRPLLRILYRSRRSDVVRNGGGGGVGGHHSAMNNCPGEDEYAKRGAALVLAYVLKAGCEDGASRVVAAGAAASVVAAAARDQRPQVGTARDDVGGLLPSPVRYQYGSLSAEAATPRSDRNRSMAMSRMKVSPPASNESNNNNNNNIHASPHPMVEETLQSLISWLTSRLQSSHNTSLGVVSPTLMVLATTPQARVAFDRAGGIGYLARHLKDTRRGNATGRRQKHQHQQHHSITSSSTVPSTLQQSTPYSRGGGGGHTNNNDDYTSATSSKRSSGKVNGVNSDGSSHSNGILSSSASSVATTAVARVAASALAFTNGTGRNILTSSTPHFTPSGGASLLASSPKAAAAASSSSSSVQQLYELVFTLWCMSLDCPTNDSIRQHFARDGAIPALAQLLKTAPREKILRLAVASLKNLATGGDTATVGAIIPTWDASTALFVKEMIACGVMRTVDTLSLRQWNDDDLVEDLDHLHTILLRYYKELTQWKVYLAEVETGVLRWGSLLHTESFFRENARQMEGSRGDFEPVKRLIYILLQKPASSGILNGRRTGNSTSSNGRAEVPSLPLLFGYSDGSFDEDDVHDDELCESLAVGLYDIGEFVRHYPNGRVIAKQLGAKEVVMKYLKHPRPEIQQQALRCASKILVNNWKAIGIADDG